MTLPSHTRLFVTGATGQLGRLVIQDLLRTVPAAQVVAGVRDAGSEGARKLAGLGVEVRHGRTMPGPTRSPRPSRHRAAVAGLLQRGRSTLGPAPERHRRRQGCGVRLIAYTAFSMPTRLPWPSRRNTAPPRRCSRRRGCPMSCCATAGTPRTMRPRSLPRSHTASSSAARGRADRLRGAGRLRGGRKHRADRRDRPGRRIYELAGDEAYTLSDFAKLISQGLGQAGRLPEPARDGFKTA